MTKVDIYANLLIVIVEGLIVSFIIGISYQTDLIASSSASVSRIEDQKKELFLGIIEYFENILPQLIIELIGEQGEIFQTIQRHYRSHVCDNSIDTGHASQNETLKDYASDVRMFSVFYKLKNISGRLLTSNNRLRKLSYIYHLKKETANIVRLTSLDLFILMIESGQISIDTLDIIDNKVDLLKTIFREEQYVKQFNKIIKKHLFEYFLEN